MWTKKRLLIGGTTYPEFSKTYYETVCTGALDGETGKLVRIYPVTLRYLNEPFRSYQWIEAEVERNTSDFRPESFRIRQESIVGGDQVTTDDGWQDRRQLSTGIGARQQRTNLNSSPRAVATLRRRSRTEWATFFGDSEFTRAPQRRAE